MKERPILFSDLMVRAILEGRKTMTRRVIKGAPNDRPVLTSHLAIWKHPPVQFWCLSKTGDMNDLSPGNIFNIGECPYGQPGDRLWVREAWDFRSWETDKIRVAYRAGGEQRDFPPPKDWHPMVYNYERWRPSIHMPRWASRLTLEITAVSVERLQDISEEDAWAEGVMSLAAITNNDPPVPRFMRLWDSINAARGFGWDANPWVWVVEFRPVEARVRGEP